MEASDNPAFDESRAASSIGKRVLVNVTLTRNGEIADMRQLVGDVISADAHEGIRLAVEGGGDYWLPPDTQSLEDAEPGTYNLRAGGSVTDPDYTSTWTIDLAEGQVFPREGFRLP